VPVGSSARAEYRDDHATLTLTAVGVTGWWLLFLVGVATLGVSVGQVAGVAVWVAGSIRWVQGVLSVSGHPTREGRRGAWRSSLGWASSPEELVWLFVQAGELEHGLLGEDLLAQCPCWRAGLPRGV